jgi:hypothetical protein
MIIVSSSSRSSDSVLAELELSNAGLKELKRLDQEKLTPAQMLAKVRIKILNTVYMSPFAAVNRISPLSEFRASSDLASHPVFNYDSFGADGQNDSRIRVNYAFISTIRRCTEKTRQIY